MATKLAGLGTLVGALVGAGRKKDTGESRGGAVARSAGTGLAVDAGIGLGGLAGTGASGLTGVRRLVRLNPHLRDMLRGMSTKGKLRAQLNPAAIAEGHLSGSTLTGVRGGLHRTAPALMALLGGAGAYQLAKREPETPIQKLRKTFKLGHSKEALSINRDDGIDHVVARLHEGLKQARARKAAASKAAATKTAALTALGAGYGAVRQKDPGESRGEAVARSAGTGLAGDLGGLAGAGIGAVVPGIMSHAANQAGKQAPRGGTLRRLLAGMRRSGRGLGLAGALAGGVLGSTMGMTLAGRPSQPRRVPITPPGSPASY